MDLKDILSKCDHTMLKVDCTKDDINKLCKDAIKYGTASVCIPPTYVKFAKDKFGDKLQVGTVIGFPNGYSTSITKLNESIDAVANGADELDLVINVSKLKSGDTSYIFNEIADIKNAIGDKILKIIIETCLLTEDEKIEMCKVVSDAGADFIKTSTGFSTGGATVDDIKLFKENVSSNVKIKAAGGISSLEDAEALLKAGADRLGTSKIVNIAKEQEKE